MTPDLRHLAIILNVGAGKAEEYQDAALASALTAMAEVAVMLHVEDGQPDAIWDVAADFAHLAERFQ
jgi:hypothetical protein